MTTTVVPVLTNYHEKMTEVIAMTHEAFEPYEPADLIDMECYSLMRFECEFESHLDDEVFQILMKKESGTCFRKRIVLTLLQETTLVIPLTFHKRLEGDGWLVQRHRSQLPSPLSPRAQHYYQEALRLLKKVLASYRPHEKLRIRSPNQIRMTRWATLKVLNKFLPTDVARRIVESVYQA